MGQVRVFEAAKEHDIDVQELLTTLKNMGVKVRSHMSPVDQAEIDRAVASLGKKKDEGAKDKKAAGGPTLIRRRKKDQEEAPEPQVAEPVAGEPGAEETEKPEEHSKPDDGAEPLGDTPEKAGSESDAPAGKPDKQPQAATTGRLQIVRPAPEKPPVGEKQEKPEKEKTPVARAKSEKDRPSREKAEDKGHKPAAEQHRPKAAEPGAEPKEEEKEYGLKVVRFIRPEDRPETFVPPPSYPMTKDEREARRAERKAKKKKGKKVDKAEQKRTVQKTKITVPKAIKRRIKISDIITVGELAKRMGVKSTEVIKALMSLGIFATINQVLDADTATLVAEEFSYEIENVAVTEEDILQRETDKPEDLQHRPPVITVMGHVDHGKTSLLDSIRMTRVAAGESGGITQHIGAYKVETSRGTLVFLDTPGHEAFTEMRARGAKVTDIVVLVVAANDGVMPQTVEAVHHAEAAGVPIIVAINKIDLPDSNPDRVKRELSEQGHVPEEWGGNTIFVPVSAKHKTGIEDLLEMIALQAEVMDLKANPNKPASGIVVEARLDRGRGPVATVLVQEGTLNLGDIVLSGQYYGRVRTLTNDNGKREKKIEPGIPVEITGLSGVPQAGDTFTVVETERVAKEISGRRVDKTREAEMVHQRRVSLDDLHDKIAEGEMKNLRIIVKADVQGSVEAVSSSLEKLTTSDVKVNVIHKGVGGILESDVNLAIASEAIVVGFHVRAESKASQLADRSGVDIRLYDVIYDATDDVKKAMSGLLAPRLQEKFLGRAEIRQTFKVPKVGTVAGCHVTEGVVQRNARLRLIRDNVVVWEGTLSSLKRFKDDAREVREGFECGLSVQDYNDIKIGDVLEFYQIEEIAQTV